MILEIQYKKKKYAFQNSYQEKLPKEEFLLWAKIRFKVFQPSKIQEINNERRVFYQMHIRNGLRPGDIWFGNSQEHYLDFQLAEDTGIIWNVLTMAAPGVPGDLRKSRKSALMAQPLPNGMVCRFRHRVREIKTEVSASHSAVCSKGGFSHHRPTVRQWRKGEKAGIFLTIHKVPFLRVGRRTWTFGMS